jgi:hypothetical protein
MSRVTELDHRYAASAALARHGVELITVHDALAARFDAVTRRLFRLIQRDGPGVWDDLAGAAKSLRWRLATDPLPIEYNEALALGVQQVVRQVTRLRGAVDEPELLSEMTDAAATLLTRDPLIGRILVDSVHEVGVDTALVVAASSRAREALSAWLMPGGIRVLTLGDLERAEVPEEIAYFVGPPRFFKPTAVTAPRTSEVTFIVPTWFGDRSIPRSAIADYAEGGIRVSARLVEAGEPAPEATEQTVDSPDIIPEEELLPQPFWGARQSESRAPTADELEARKVLLSGGRAIWLDDDGERIRALDPTQPAGERVVYADVSTLSPGTYLLLREGLAERQALHARAFDRTSNRAAAIRESQDQWKSVLSERLRARGVRESEQALRAVGVHAAGQVRSWSSPHVIRPQSDRDFELLLGWLDLPIQPFFGNASVLRHEVHRATRELRDRLEAAADVADLHELERIGHMTLDIEDPGFRGMFVTRVMGVSPFTELVARHEARVPFEDRGAQWLE